MTTRTHITDPMKVVMAIRVTTTDTTHEPEGGARRLRELRNPLPWSEIRRKGPFISQAPATLAKDNTSGTWAWYPWGSFDTNPWSAMT